MRRAFAILFAIWAAAACASVDGDATVQPAAPSPTAVAAASPTPTRSPIATRIAWPPMAERAQLVGVHVQPGSVKSYSVPALVASSSSVLATAAAEFAARSMSSQGIIAMLQNMRAGAYHGSEPYMFRNMIAPSAFADRVRDMITTTYPDETRAFVTRSAQLDRAWNLSNGVLVVEGSISFDDEINTSTGGRTESHAWVIRALLQGGNYFIVDGAEAPGTLATMSPFDLSRLDREVTDPVSELLLQEEVVPGGGRPWSPYQGTPYWDARKGAMDWLFKLAEQGVLSDRHFDGMTVQVVEFAPTTYFGDGIVTVRLTGTLVEIMRGTRHAYPVNELVRFQRTGTAQPFWLAVDGQNDEGTWIANGNYGTPQSTAHG